MRTLKLLFSLSLVGFVLISQFGCSGARNQVPETDYEAILNENLVTFLDNARQVPSLGVSSNAKLDSFKVDFTNKMIKLWFNDDFGYMPIREKTIQQLNDLLKGSLDERFDKFEIEMETLDSPIEALVPNYFRNELPIDTARLPIEATKPAPLVTPLDRGFSIKNGLDDRYIALWPSHGWYYEHKLKRWEWQRARLFQTVEDLLPYSFIVPYLIPMLENAGATVFLPRERDTQTEEFILDTEVVDEGVTIRGEWLTQNSGFGIGNPPYHEGENPFQQGTYRKIDASMTPTGEVIWQPTITNDGEYAVYIAYKSLPESVRDVQYRVVHAGGETNFSVNQKIGGSTWIYLGTFEFEQGTKGKVILTNESQEKGVVTADAIRFGGGMGIIEREGKTSERPKFVEGARYWLQFAGMPDSLVYNVAEQHDNDYIDDYRSRGEWVNYLRGAPFGPEKNQFAKGLGIPIDLSLAFHTDAGINHQGKTIGTLMIYNSVGNQNNRLFPDGVSRLANRDFGDILQTQIVDDIRSQFDSTWSRRQIWDKDYSEAFRPNVPSALLELLSHQNFWDMKFAHDPRFKFAVSRAMYKGMLRFIAQRSGFEPIIQPLPITHFSARAENGGVQLSWKPQPDSLETSAMPTAYKVYTRINRGGFDNGKLVNNTTLFLPNLNKNTHYSFKITAVNQGGESFPSEVLSVYLQDSNAPIVLIVNGFDRVAPPTSISTDNFQGFLSTLDAGVPDGYDLNFVGNQHNFFPKIPWKDDDAPGYGASDSDFETQIIAGNTHDFVIKHGEAIARAGYSYCAASDEAFWEEDFPLENVQAIDLLLGEEKKTEGPRPYLPTNFETFPEELQQKVKTYLSNGGKMLISGAYVGTDLVESKPENHPDVIFAKDVLKMKWHTNFASKSGEIVPEHEAMPNQIIRYQIELNDIIYAVEAPDGFEPIISEAKTLYRYADSQIGAGYIYKGDYDLAVLGFPFETIQSEEDSNNLMIALLKLLFE